MARRERTPKDPEGRMPLKEHLLEFRNRLMVAATAIIVGAIVGWVLYDGVTIGDFVYAGVYEQLIGSASHVLAALKRLLIGPDRLVGFREEARRTDWLLIAPVLIGMASAVLLVAGAMEGFVNSLGGISGRKTLIHVSDGIPLIAGGEVWQQALELSRRQRHRGPDWSGIYADDEAILAHERLAIVGVDSGAQPLLAPGGAQVLAVNGEIYNHRALRQRFEADYPFTTHSDCEVILPLYRMHGAEFLPQLEGMFAFVLWDAERHRYLVARDPLGIVPLYFGHDAHGNLFVASELKALAPVCRDAREFPPGHFLVSDAGSEPQPYYRPGWREFAAVAGGAREHAAVRSALEAAVRSHMMSDVPYGVLLSGGLDSSLIAAIAKKYAARRVEDDERSAAWWPQLHSFAVGLEGAPDLAAARKVADHIGTVHHEFHFTIQEGFDALSDVIYHLETYDVTTIRAATPMYPSLATRATIRQKTNAAPARKREPPRVRYVVRPVATHSITMNRTKNSSDEPRSFWKTRTPRLTSHIARIGPRSRPRGRSKNSNRRPARARASRWTTR